MPFEREFLKEHGVPEDKIENIMSEHGKTVAQITTDRDGIRAQLETAQTALKSFEGVDVAQLQGKITELTNDLNGKDEAHRQQLTELEREYAEKEAVSGLQFSSDSAKRAFLADLHQKKYPVESGKVVGLDDFVTAYKKNDPGAFAVDGKKATGFRVTGEEGKQDKNDIINAAIRAAAGKGE